MTHHYWGLEREITCKSPQECNLGTLKGTSLKSSLNLSHTLTRLTCLAASDKIDG